MWAIRLVDPVGAKAAARLQYEEGQSSQVHESVADDDYRREYRRAHVSGIGASVALESLRTPSRAQAYTRRLALRRAQDHGGNTNRNQKVAV